MSPTDTCTFKITRKLICPDLQITIFDNLSSICIIMQFKGAVIASWLVYTFSFIMLITSPQMLQEQKRTVKTVGLMHCQFSKPQLQSLSIFLKFVYLFVVLFIPFYNNFQQLF